MNGEQNFKEVVIEQFYEVCMSFQDDPYEATRKQFILVKSWQRSKN